MTRVSFGTRLSASVLAHPIPPLASSYCDTVVLPSPASTVFIRSDITPSGPLVQMASIVRILRYVSPNPWGCVSSEAYRQSNSLELIRHRALSSTPHTGSSSQAGGTSQLTTNSSMMTPFSAGSEVLWSPAILRPDGRIRLRQKSTVPPKGTPGWLVHRLPPPSHKRSVHHAGKVTFTVDSGMALHEHRVFEEGSVISLRIPIDSVRRKTEVLFDCRFALTIDAGGLARTLKRDSSNEGLIKIRLNSHGRYYLPRLSLVSGIDNEEMEEVLWACPESTMDCVRLACPPWLTVESTRTLSRL